MTSETSKASSTGMPANRVIAMWVLGILLALPVMWKIGTGISAQIYENKVVVVVTHANSLIDSTNSEIQKLTGDPSTASAEKSKLQDAAKQMDGIVSELAAIKPPNYAVRYQSDLAALYRDYSAYYRDLAQVADFFDRRGAAMNQLGASIDKFSSGIGKAKNQQQVLAVAATLEGSARGVVGQIQSLPDPAILIYSTSKLQKLVGTLGSAADGIQKAIKSKNGAAAIVAIHKMQGVFTSDWAGALFETDKSRLDGYAKRMVDLERRRAQLAGERPRQ